VLHLEPAPSQPVPIWCGGHSGPAMRRAARLCDGWIGNAYPMDECKHYVGELRAARDAAGRGDGPFEILLGVYDLPTPDCAGFSMA
jgi:alkanesulfonate monooxygenase SsuD/methylene tetrahydromethanopterin reductase-like flavin-dependent oxidoreductase (luciferase family)